MSMLLKRLSDRISSLRDHLRSPESQTYYPQEKRKSNFVIWIENLWWILKYHRINHYYYVYGFDRKTGVNKSDYLEESVFCRLRDESNRIMWAGGHKTSYPCLLRDKFLFGQYLKALGFPTPAILGFCDKNSVIWLDTRQVEPLENLMKQNSLDVFVKELLGEGADGVYPLKIEQGKLYLNNKQATIKEFKETIKDKCIIQKRISQHPQMNKLYPHSVNTVRLVTARSREGIVMLSALLRLGANGNQCDNWAAGGITVGIDLETSRLSEKGMFKPGFGRRVFRHPDTGVEFKNFEIPYLSKAINMAKELHSFFYGIHSVGWDVAITNDGPVFIEGNENWDTQMMQVLDSNIKKKFLAALPVQKSRVLN
jgi:hypothetical protein